MVYATWIVLQRKLSAGIIFETFYEMQIYLNIVLMLTHFYVVTNTTTISAKDVFVLKGIKLGWKVVDG